MDTKSFVKQFYKANKLNFAVIMLAYIFAVGIHLFLSYLIRQITNVATSGGLSDMLYILYYALGLVGACVVFMCLKTVVLPRFKARAARQYKDFVYNKLLRKSISSFGVDGSATYISALTNDLNTIETNYIENIFDLVEKLLVFVGALAMMFYYSAILTAVGVALTVIPLAISLVMGVRLGRLEKAVSDYSGEFVHFTTDSLNGFSVIKSFKVESKMGELFGRSDLALEKAKERRDRGMIFMNELCGVFGILAQIGVFALGAYLCITSPDTMQVGTIIMFVQLMNYVINPMTTVPDIIAKRRAVKPLIKKVADALSVSDAATEKTETASHERAIELKNVSFAYGDGANVLDGIDCTFEKGKAYAIVGASGSGKTTLFNILLGTFDGYGGSVLFDGKELRSISSESLYDCVSLVSQNVFVFDDTVENNVTMYKNADRDILADAVRRAALNELVEEKGLDYGCGVNGKNLSGGQIQRISIARGLLKAAPVLLMDEVTSALDAETAAAINAEALSVPGVTKIAITHRLDESTLSRYDNILFMKNGRIAERGTFSELMRADGLFASMFKLAQ